LVMFNVIITPLYAQVAPIPWLKPTWTNNSGQPCSGCLLNTYIAGTTTPQGTFSDALGLFPNSDPVVLDATGRAFVFLSANSYKFVMTTSGGIVLWTVDNITASNLSLLASNNTWLGTNTFQAQTTFNGPVRFNVGFTSLGPNTLGGGGSMSGTFSGSPIFSGTPNFSAGFLATTGTFSGQITSTVTTGTPPFIVASTTQVANLNASQLEGFTWEIPSTIGITTPNTGKFTTLNATTSLTLNGSTAQTGVQGTDTKLLSAGTVAGTGAMLCTDANGGATTSGCPSLLLFSNTFPGGIALTGANATIGTINLTMPASGCPCRIEVSYSIYISTGPSPTVNIWVSDGSQTWASTQMNYVNTVVGGQAATDWSPTTYANNAAVTLTLSGRASGTPTSTVAAPTGGSGTNSYFKAVVMSSN
jgi:hypothetical protein